MSERSETNHRGRLLAQAMEHAADGNTALHHIDLRSCPHELRDAIREAREASDALSTLVGDAIKKHLGTTRVDV